jgi:hypothetical protein
MWYHGHNLTCEPSYLMGTNHGTIVETPYTDREHPVIKNLERICRNSCRSAWSIGYFPDKYKGITFRFFASDDMELFNTARQQIEGGF